MRAEDARNQPLTLKGRYQLRTAGNACAAKGAANAYQSVMKCSFHRKVPRKSLPWNRVLMVQSGGNAMSIIEHTNSERPTASTNGQTVLIVDDDTPFSQRLARAIEGRGFTVRTAETVADALSHVGQSAPAFAVVDMRLNDGNGLEVVS